MSWVSNLKHCFCGTFFFSNWKLYDKITQKEYLVAIVIVCFSVYVNGFRIVHFWFIKAWWKCFTPYYLCHISVSTVEHTVTMAADLTCPSAAQVDLTYCWVPNFIAWWNAWSEVKISYIFVLNKLSHQQDLNPQEWYLRVIIG